MKKLFNLVAILCLIPLIIFGCAKKEEKEPAKVEKTQGTKDATEVKAAPTKDATAPMTPVKEVKPTKDATKVEKAKDTKLLMK